MTQIKDIIYSTRQYMRLNQKDFSKILNKSQAMVSKYESGESIPPGNILKKCQDILHGDSVQQIKVDKGSVEVEELIRLIKKKCSGDKMAEMREAIHHLIMAVTEH